MDKKRMAHEDIIELKRWNTPTIYNGWEQITNSDAASEGFNPEETKDFMPQMGPMAGFAVTVQCQPSKIEHKKANPEGWKKYRDYVASVSGPKIVVVQDLDKPGTFGAFWGEVNSNIHRSLGCVGTITDGAVRDIDEMANAGFKALARRLCVGHAHNWPVKWNCEVEVFGRKVRPGQFIHADKHGFLAVPEEDEEHLLKASRIMDTIESRTIITAARSNAGKSLQEILEKVNAAGTAFGKMVQEQFSQKGEW